MGTVQLSCHAAVRKQQRGIPDDVLEYLVKFGSVSYDHKGGAVLHFDKRAKVKCSASLGMQGMRMLEKYFDVYAVKSQDGTLMTVGHRYKRLPRC